MNTAAIFIGQIIIRVFFASIAAVPVMLLCRSIGLPDISTGAIAGIVFCETSNLIGRRQKQ